MRNARAKATSSRLTTQSAERTTTARAPEREVTANSDLSTRSVRELVANLTQIEDTLRATPFLIPREGLMVVNPEVAPLLARQRSIVSQLRARRISWRAGSVPTPRTPSASWPRPPWT